MHAGQIVARARACVGVQFRPQGRDPAIGLDCAGLAGAAFGIAGLPADYRLRGGDPAVFATMIASFGFSRVENAGAGDLAIVETGPRHYHLIILTGEGFIHAHAGLRRVVETPGPCPWPILSVWRRGD